MDVKMFQMGFGESILVSKGTECLLIDCGSESANKKTYFQNVITELNKYDSKSAMLSHFHRDHINGFADIVRNQKHTFQDVYIPYIFTYSHPNYVDFDIIRSILEKKACPNYQSISIWELLKLLEQDNWHIHLLKRNDLFHCAGEDFQVLWPIPEKLAPVRTYNTIKNVIPENILDRIEKLSDLITQRFYSLVTDGGIYDRPNDYGDNGIDENVSSLQLLFETTVLLDEKTISQLLNSLQNNANKASIVFHNASESNPKKFLFTADVPENIMKNIAQNKYDNVSSLHTAYYAIKAPHHGTDTYFFDFGRCFSCDKMFISNGDTTQSSRGRISCKYNINGRKYAIMCTNTNPLRCKCVCKCCYATDQCGCSGSYMTI